MKCVSDTTLHGWQVDWADEPGPELLRLFESAFGHALPLEQWHWKYRFSQPMGTLLSKGGVPVAFFGGMPRDLMLLGKKVSAVQLGDVMVAPSERGAFTKHGALYHAAATFVQALIGTGKKYDCGFGFPSLRHHRLGERLGLYAKVSDLLEASWQAKKYRMPAMCRVEVYSSSTLGEVEALWDEMNRQLNDLAVLSRNKAYVGHRFFDHPVVNYRKLMVRKRFSGQPLGLAMLRDHGEEGFELLDMIGPLQNMALMVNAANSYVAKEGRDRLTAWLTEPVVKAVNLSGTQVKSLNIPSSVITGEGVDSLEHTKSRWWVMGGDSDFR